MIFITSYTYFSPRHFNIFRYFKKKDDLVFILPEKWKEKNGDIVYLSDEQKSEFNVIPAKAFFYHSQYPIIRGLLKGYMPATEKILKKMAKRGDVLYTAMEPNLLTTYFNGLTARKLGLKHVFAACQNVSYKKRLRGLKLYISEKLIKKNISLSFGAVCGVRKAYSVLESYMPPNFPTVILPISGVNTEKFKPGIDSNFRSTHNLNGKIVFMFVGMLEKRKGIITMLHAFKTAFNKLPNIHLVIIGMGVLEDLIKDFIAKNNMGSSITLLGWISNDRLPGVFNGADVFIYPSEPYDGWEEQLGFSILEASSSGLPIIATKMGSMDEIVLEGNSGILVNSGKIDELTDAIITLGSNSDLRNRMGQAARRHMLENFSQISVGEKLENFLRNV